MIKRPRPHSPKASKAFILELIGATLQQAEYSGEKKAEMQPNLLADVLADELWI